MTPNMMILQSTLQEAFYKSGRVSLSLLESFPKILQYAPIAIGKKVFEAIKESAFHSFESYVARKQILEGGDIGKVEKLALNYKNPDYALDNLV